MEQETEMEEAHEEVYFVETEMPYVDTEEEIATSFVAVVDANKQAEGVKNQTVSMETAQDSQQDQISQHSEGPIENVMVTSIQGDSLEGESSHMDELVEEEMVNETEDAGTDPTQCEICKKKFASYSSKHRHIRRSHHIRKVNGTNIKCIECNTFFSQITKLRQHLSDEHKLEMTEQCFRFPTMEAFKKWKCEMERKTLCSYTLRHGARKGTSGGQRYFYACHRSGKYEPKIRGPRQRMIKTQGSCKMGIMCTSSITVHINPKDVLVKYFPNHYGHGKETTLIQLSVEEQCAIAENVSKGIPYEKLLDDIRDAQSTKDHFQLHLLKKKDYRSINNAYACDDFNTSMSDSESVDHWINLCCQMENSPILYYKKEEVCTDKGPQEEFILIIMTEFQKHILESSDKEVLCVDSLYRKKGGRFYLTVLFIVDENRLAFPVAFCISNKVDKAVITLFFESICNAVGPLSCKFFMSDCETFIYESWKEIMNDNSKWLWSMWYVDSRFRIQLRVFRGDVEKRAEAYRTMRMLLECQTSTVFQSMLDKFIENLQMNPQSVELGNIVNNYYAPNAKIWAYCYRKDLDLGTNIHLEIMHRTFRYCCREGRKTRLDKFIFVIMKLVRDKMLDRLSSMLDDERIEMALETINQCHNMGVEIPPNSVTALSEKTWIVQSENDDETYYVMKENEKCPEHCNLKCFECDICVHLYVCSCLHNLINANLCQHIHAVVWHLLTPHFSPPTSPVPLLDLRKVEKPEVEQEFIPSLLKKSHEVYKQIQANKSNLNRVALNSLMKRLNECVDICIGKLVEEEKPPAPPAPVPVPVNNPSTVYLLNPNPMAIKPGNSQSIVPNIISTAGTSNFSQGLGGGGGYYIILPPAAKSTVTSNVRTS